MHYANHDPEFCIIAPTDYLDDYVTQSHSHLVLAHLVETDAKYAEFYYNNLDHDHFVIMDNGAFELGESYAPTKLIDLGFKCGADAIVLPDYPNQSSSKTIKESEAVMQKIIDAGFATMFVPQSKKGDIEDWIAAYEYASNNPNIDIIGMSILGIPNAIPHIHIAYARVVMTSILIERGIFNFDKHHHYLGLNSGPNLEIPTLLKMEALDTCDSSGPVWSAILGHEYTSNSDSFLTTCKPLMHVDFNHKINRRDVRTLNRIQHNINMTLNIFYDHMNDKDIVFKS